MITKRKRLKTKLLIAAMLLFITCNLYASESEKTVMLQTNTGTLEGTLLVRNKSKDIPVALIIAGSGPTDRDGNNQAMKNNSLKMLAVEL